MISTRRVILYGALLCLAASMSTTGAAESESAGSQAVQTAPGIVREYRAGTGGTRAASQPIVRLTLDRSSVTTADRVALTLAAAAPAGWIVKWPDIGEQLGDFRIAEWSRRDGVLVDSTPGESRLYVLEPFLPRKHRIPALDFRFKPPGAGRGTAALSIATEPVEVEVGSELGSDVNAALEPAKPPVPIDIHSDLTDRLVGAALAALVGIYPLAFLVAWRRSRQRAAEAPSPAQVANAGLAEIRRELADSDGSSEDRRRIAAHISATARHQLTSILGADARVRTAAELRVHPRIGSLEDEYRDQVLTMLGDLDQSRFAPDPPTLGELDRYRVVVERLVRRSTGGPMGSTS